MDKAPHIVIIAGPNGAGKSTTAPALLRDYLGLTTFVNADVIAQGLSGFDPERAAVEAGRIMLGRLRELAEQRADFAFETTLASRTFAPWLRTLKERSDYRVSLFYLWLPAPEIAVARVRERVSKGGHNIPDAIIRRRYFRGLLNFFELYEPLADSWQFLNNADPSQPASVAFRLLDGTLNIVDESAWDTVRREVDDQSREQEP